MKSIFYIILTVLMTLSIDAFAQNPEPCSGKCLTKEQVDILRKMVDELDDIHKSPAVIEFQDSLIVTRDWNGRVYVNGGVNSPLRAKIRIGKHIDRDMRVTLNPHVWYRPEPPEPMFRLRIRAQAGVLAPELIQKIKGDDGVVYPLDAGLSWDFFHLGTLNLSAFTGIRSVGAGPGLDLTKNFGLYTGYSMLYDGFKSSVSFAAYFSFN